MRPCAGPQEVYALAAQMGQSRAAGGRSQDVNRLPGTWETGRHRKVPWPFPARASEGAQPEASPASRHS